MAGNLVALSLALCLLFTVELNLVQPAPISLNTQFQTALQYVAALKGNGTFEDCCDVSDYSYYCMHCHIDRYMKVATSVHTISLQKRTH